MVDGAEAEKERVIKERMIYFNMKIRCKQKIKRKN
jgi:hypothetical protein